MRLFCTPCAQEMIPVKNGEKISLNETVMFSSDRYKCMICGHEVNITPDTWFEGTETPGTLRMNER